jgi:Lrp/AsnC family transcriptional regulator, regulator for asnA, asnC and gidA
MDDTDLRIVAVLAEDGRMPNSEIARRLGVSEGTVRQRLKKLIDTGIVKIQAMVNSEEVPNLYPVLIGIKLEGREIERFAEQINQFSEVQRTMVITGRYDILISLLLDSHRDLVDFVTTKLWKIPGVRDSETYICLKNYDPWFTVNCLAPSGPASD